MIKTLAEPVYFLLVDDREENLVTLEALLRREGLILLMARSGPDALELLLRHDVALALVDVQMPGMDGFELAELMRGTERTRRVPIIFLTAGSADQRRRFRGYGTGAVDFLGKPLEPDVLRSKVDVFFELARQRDELKSALSENARLLEESRRHAAALKETDRLKDEFLAMLAHELRNPLSAVSNAIQLWKRSVLEAHQSWAKQVIENQMRTFSRLIDDLLDVSRINHGKIHVKKQVMDPRPVLDQAVTAVTPLVQERKHDLFVELRHGPALVDVDPTRLEQVVVNLLTNAAKYSEDGSRIRLSTSVGDGSLLIRVEDTGIGIAADQLPRMFELFAQGDRSIARSEGGLGIGLTLVRSLVELHGGTIQAESPGLGRGSAFTVRLPLASGTDASPVDGQADAESTGEGREKLLVLVVDDNVDTAWGLGHLLQLHGHDVVVAHDGPKAVEQTTRARPDVVLLDIGLPGMNGYDAARKIREEAAIQPTLMVAVTGYGQDKDRSRAQEAGFNHHLTKPVQLERLLELMEEVKPRGRKELPGQDSNLERQDQNLL